MIDKKSEPFLGRVTSILRFIPPPHYNISGGGEIPPKYSAKIPLPPSLTPAFATAPQETLISSQLHFTPSSQFSLQKLQSKTGRAVLSPHFWVVLVFFNGCCLNYRLFSFQFFCRSCSFPFRAVGSYTDVHRNISVPRTG